MAAPMAAAAGAPIPTVETESPAATAPPPRAPSAPPAAAPTPQPIHGQNDSSSRISSDLSRIFAVLMIALSPSSNGASSLESKFLIPSLCAIFLEVSWSLFLTFCTDCTNFDFKMSALGVSLVLAAPENAAK